MTSLLIESKSCNYILSIKSANSTILGVDIISTTVTTINITTNIVRLIVTKAITNPAQVITLTAY